MLSFTTLYVSEGGKAWNHWGFFYLIYWVSDSIVRTKWLHSLIHKASINKSVLGFFDIPIGYRDIHM